jgi:hypothetical protein
MPEEEADGGAEVGFDPAEWERDVAKALFNGTWTLIDKPDRTGEDDIQMLLSAMAGRWHWGRVGGPEQVATSDWQVGHVASLVGFGTLALVFANRNLALAIAEEWDGWRLASAHEGVARACAVLGDVDGLNRHYAEAEAALAREPDDEEREIIADQLKTIPREDSPS